MLIVFIVVAAVATTIIGLVVVGREVSLSAARARPAVFDLEEAVGFIGDGLPPAVASRLTYDDVRWVLRADVDLLEEATAESEHVELGTEVLDEGSSLARLLTAADRDGVELADADIAVILDGRTRYLKAIGAIGPQAPEPG
jgi:hypothetical protein